jgi:hypothetical protein
LAPATVRYVRATGGCSTPTDTTTITISATSHDIPECVGNNSNAVYTAHYYPVDRLGNVGLRVASSASFGIDRTAPQIRFTTDTAIMAPDQSINSTKTNAFRIEALDERSGLTSAAGVSFTRTLRRSSSLANSGWAAASDNFCNGLAAATGTTGFGSLFITGPVCAYSTTGNDFTGALTADGYSIAPAVTMASLGTTGSGYYTYRARVSDEAGNTAEITRRVVLADAVAPSASATVTIAPISSTYAGPFAGSFVDDVETRGTGLVVNYGGSLALAYPMQATSAVAFDNVITRDSLFTGTTPFTSGVLLYTDLEATSSGAPQGNTGLAQLSGFSVYAQDFGDNRRTSSPANFLGGSITNDAAVWNSNGSGTKFASATQQIATFSVVPSTETFNSPAGGLKAQAIGPSNTFNSPFTRVDFYRQIPTTTTWEFVGSVDGTAVPCQNVAQTCNVYIGEGAGQRAITYVLRQGGTGATSFNPIALNDGTYIAIGTTGTKGRGLLSDTDTFAPPAPPAP